MKRVICLICAVLMLLPMLFACKKKEEDEKTVKRDELLNKASAANFAADEIRNNHIAAENEFQKKIWKKTNDTRKKYPDTQDGFKREMDKFVKALMGNALSDATDEECEALYNTVYGAEKPSYAEYRTVNTIPVSELMKTPIGLDTLFITQCHLFQNGIPCLSCQGCVLLYYRPHEHHPR